MPPTIHPGELFFFTQVLSSIVIALASFAIFWRLRKFVQLTDHEGIRYFHYAFFFFGLNFLLPLHKWLGFRGRPPIYFIILLIFSGTMAIFCLLYSVFYKRIKPKSVHPLLLMVVISLLMSLITFLLHARPLILLLHVALFSLALGFSFIEAQRNKAHALRFHILYVLLFLSWTANAAAQLTVRTFYIAAITLNVLSVLLFVAMFAKVIQKTKLQ